jgi:hypothetical protein
MDPQLRKLLEVTHEAWVDSGVDVKQLRGSDRVRCRRPPAPCGHASMRLGCPRAPCSHASVRRRCLRVPCSHAGMRISCFRAPCRRASLTDSPGSVAPGRRVLPVRAVTAGRGLRSGSARLQLTLAAGAQVGVYLGCCGSEVHALWLGDINNITGYEQTGCVMSMFANRLSFTYDFKGPSKAVDTGARQA